MIYQLIKGNEIIYTIRAQLKDDIVVFPLDNGSIHYQCSSQQLLAIGIDVYFPNENKLINDQCQFIYQHMLFKLLCLSTSKFDYYSYNYPLTIGKNDLNDIIAEIDEEGFFDNGKIALSRLPYVDGKENKIYTIGQTIQIDKIIIIIHPDFVMINRGQHHVKLEIFHPHKESIKIEFHKDYSPPYRADSIEYSFEYQLNNMPSYRTYEPSPLVSTLGPGLTMASASLFLAGFNIYSNFQSGKTLDTSIPMLIFPLAMVVSLIFWQPVIRYFEKKRCKKYNQIQYEAYMVYLDELIIKINQDLNNYKQTIYGLLSNSPYSIQPHHRLFFRLYLGQVKHQDIIKLIRQSNVSNPMIDPEIDQIILDYKSETYPLMFDFVKSKKLAIVGHDPYLRHIIYQLVFSRSYNDIKCVIFSSKSNVDEYFSTNHFYQNTIYLQVTNLMTRQYVLNSIKDQSVIAIVFEKHLFVGLENDYYAIYYYENLDQIKDAFECIIDQNLIRLNEDVQLTCDIKNDYRASFDLLRQYRLKQSSIHSEILTSFFDLNQLAKPYNQVILDKWKNNKHGLEVLIGINEYQMPISLNLHESYDGPHGLIAGTTGSGKTELLISLLLGLCTNYSYKEVQLVLIDFKGVNLIECFRGFPHLVGEVSNIELSSLKRALISLKNECIKRERAFESLSKYIKHSVGSFDSYSEHYDKKSGLDNFARLVIVVDEFAELKRQSPEFIEELVSIARVGRSLGFHLIMATQKPSGVIDAQIWANMHYKICLRVQDKQDALDVIESTDSYYLQKPGSFYLKSSRIYLKAQATLATCAYQDFKFNNAVHLYKDHGLKVESAKMERLKSKNQLQIIKESIHFIVKGEKIKPNQLWLAPLIPQYLNTYLNVELNSINKIIIGMSDDLQQALHKPKAIDLRQDCPLLIRTTSTHNAKILVQSIIESCDTKRLSIYILDDQQGYQRFKHEDIYYVDTKIDCNIDYFLRHVKPTSLVIVNGIEFCLNSETRWQKLINLSADIISLIVVDSKKQLSQQKIAYFKKNWVNGLTKYEFDSPLKIDLKDYELYDGDHVVCLFKPSVVRGRKITSKQYLKRPVTTKHLMKKWVVGYDILTLKPIFLSYTCALSIQGSWGDYYCIKMEKTLSMLPKTSTLEAILWLDEHFPPVPFSITSAKRRENEALLYYEGKTQIIYLAYE